MGCNVNAAALPLAGCVLECPDDLSYALSVHASIATTADTDQHLVGTIAQKAVDGAANLIAHSVQIQQDVKARCGLRARRLEHLRRGEISVKCWRGAIGSAAVL